MEEGYVYLLTDFSSVPEKYKIGITKNDIEKRIQQLQTGCSGEVVLLRKFKSIHYKKIERLLHKKYFNFKSMGGEEWFELPDKNVLNFIDECKKIETTFNQLKNNPFI